MSASKQVAQQRADRRRGAGAKAGIFRPADGNKYDGPYLSDVAGFTSILDRLTLSGDAIVIARTRDGGAIAFTVLSGDEREKAYAGTQSELDELISQLMERYPPNVEGP